MSAADVTVEVTDHPVLVEAVHGYVYVELQDASVEVITSGPPGPPGAGTPSGGTTGQVLAKASDVDHDVAWVDPSGGPGVGGSGLPDATAAAAKDILALDDNKAPVWSPELSNLETTLGEVRQAIGDPSPLHINNTLSEWLGDLSDEVHRLSARPAFSLDGILHVDNMAGFARVFSNTPVLEDGTEKWIEFELAVTPTTGGSVFTDVAQVASSGGPLVRAGGTQGPVVGANDGAISTKALAGYIGENRICRVVFDKTNPVRPVLKILETLDAIPTGASNLRLGSLYDVTAPASTPAGKVLGTTAEGSWGPVDAGVGTDPLAPAGRAGEYPTVAVYADLPQTGNWAGRRIQAGSVLYEWTGTMWGYVVKPGLLSASGDLLTRSSSGLVRLPVGVDGQVLTADSTAPTRIAWKSAPDGGGGGVTDHGALTGLSDPDHPISAVIGLQTALDSKAASTDLAAVAETVPTAIAAHEAAADPHPQYLTQARGDTRYPVNASGVASLWAGTQAAYDAITTKSPSTVYFITG